VRGRIIRPLIFITRKEIEQYLESKGIPYVIDSSNLETTYLRNRIRLELIPYLETIRPGSFDKIRETAEFWWILLIFSKPNWKGWKKRPLRTPFHGPL